MLLSNGDSQSGAIRQREGTESILESGSLNSHPYLLVPMMVSGVQLCVGTCALAVMSSLA